jgi:glycosyltransferase involved in cell wall biosynthesis
VNFLFSLCGDRTKASSRVRGFWIAEALEELGHAHRLRVTDNKLQLLLFARDILWADAVIFQKTYSRYHYALMRFAKILGKKVYVDIDDLPSRSGSPQTLRNYSNMVCAADAVFAGSAELAKDAAEVGGQACLVPTGVKVSNYSNPSKNKDPLAESTVVCIGWIGNGNHYEDDLVEVLLPALQVLADECRFKLKLVGVAGSRKLHTALPGDRSFDVELVDQLNWADSNEIAAQLASFDIGVYPLLDNTFNARKCGFKALEYMATGIPVVASSNGANAGIVIQAKTGYLAANEKEWAGSLARLVQDAALRRQMGGAGRSRVEAQFDVSTIARKIVDVVEGRASSA